MDKLWYIQTIKYYSVLKKKKKRERFQAMKRHSTKYIIINEFEKDADLKRLLTYDSNCMASVEDGTMVTVKRSVDCQRGVGEREEG